MIGFFRRLVVFTAFLAWALGVFAAPRAAHVFVISIDGGSPEVMQRSAMPVLKELAKEGAHTWLAQTIVPSITLPAHTSMLTGVRPDKHHITWNNWVPTKGVVRVPTVFAAAHAAGLSTAMFVGKEKFRHLLQPGTVDVFNFDRAASVVVSKNDSGGATNMKTEENVTARVVAEEAADYIVKNKPNLCFIHFPDPDSVGHKIGWGSPEQIKAFAATDAALGVVREAIVRAGIEKDSVIIVTADHGGHGRGHGQGTPADMTIPWIAWGKGVKPHSEITAPVSTCDTAATTLWLLGLEPATPLDGAPVMSALE
jgi:predicted AlkP superfamily pyrophosphatase or phosphodiesterase